MVAVIIRHKVFRNLDFELFHIGLNFANIHQMLLLLSQHIIGMSWHLRLLHLLLMQLILLIYYFDMRLLNLLNFGHP